MSGPPPLVTKQKLLDVAKMACAGAARAHERAQALMAEAVTLNEDAKKWLAVAEAAQHAARSWID